MAEPASIPAPLEFHTELKALAEAADQWGPSLTAAYGEAFLPPRTTFST